MTFCSYTEEHFHKVLRPGTNPVQQAITSYIAQQAINQGEGGGRGIKVNLPFPWFHGFLNHHLHTV